MADESVTDPLRHYTREELISLIERLAEENQTLRDQADHFERLYLDIIHSTSWKLAWPIRADSRCCKRVAPCQPFPAADCANLPSGSPETVLPLESNPTGQRRASPVLQFLSKSALNLLISRHPEPPPSKLFSAAGGLASARTLPLRIICLDPQLTARDCLQVLKQKPEAADWILYFTPWTCNDRPFTISPGYGCPGNYPILI
jgi:hypothetical protein